MGDFGFDVTETAEKILRELRNEKNQFGFSYNELLDMGFSEDTIELVKQKYEILKKTPMAQLTLVNIEAYGRIWVITGIDPINSNATESYRFTILNVKSKLTDPISKI